MTFVHVGLGVGQPTFSEYCEQQQCPVSLATGFLLRATRKTYLVAPLGNHLFEN